MSFNDVIMDDNVDIIWLYWWDVLRRQKVNHESRDGVVVGEIIDATTILTNPTNNMMFNDVRKLDLKYALGEWLWYLSANDNLSEIQKYSSGWNRVSDDGVTVNSNYGYCIKKKYGFDQWEYVRNLLIKNPNTRQAIIHFKHPSNKESKDVNCAISLQFFIRDNKLYAITYMRSNDIWLGFPYDIYTFCNFQILMSMQLGVELGHYIHKSASLHLYKRDSDRVDKNVRLTQT